MNTTRAKKLLLSGAALAFVVGLGSTSGIRAHAPDYGFPPGSAVVPQFTQSGDQPLGGRDLVIVGANPSFATNPLPAKAPDD